MTEAEFARGLTTRVLVIGIIISVVLGIYYMTDLTVMTPGNLGSFGLPYLGLGTPLEGNTGAFGIAIIMVFIVSLLSSKVKFSRQEITCLLTMILMAPVGIIWGIMGLGPSTMYGAFTASPPVKAAIFRDASPLMFVKDQTAYGALLQADAPINWAAWGTPTAFAILFMLTTFLFIIFLSSLVRKLYVDIEALPFPIAPIENEMISLTQPASASPRLYKDKLFWIGFVVVFVISSGAFWSLLFPGAKSIWQPLTTVWRFSTDLTPQAIIPWMPFMINFTPTTIAFGYLLPLNALLTAIIGIFFAWWFFGPFFSALGIITQPFPKGYGADIAAQYWAYFTPPVSRWYAIQEWVELAIMLTVVVYPLLIHRKTVAKIFKGMVRKVEGEETEPFNYRVLWAGTLGLGLLLLAELISLGVTWWLAILTMIFLPFFFLSWIRVRGEAGIGSGEGALGGTLFPKTGFTPAGIASTLGIGGLGVAARTAGGVEFYNTLEFGSAVWERFSNLRFPGMTMEYYKLGAMNKAQSRDIMLSAIIPIVIIVPLASVMYVVTIHKISLSFPSTIPLGNLIMPSWTAAHPYTFMGAVDVWNTMGRNPIGTLIVFFVTVAVVIGMYILRARTRWFNLVPAALVLAFHYWAWNNLIPYIVAYVLKFITLRVFGVEAYQKKALPLLTGIFVGMGFVILIAMIPALCYVLGLFGLKPPV